MFVVYRHYEGHRARHLAMGGEEFAGFISTWELNNQSGRPWNEVDYSKLETLYYIEVDKEELANRIAEYCASKTPGTDWYVAKLTSKVTSKAAPITTIQYTEKGALPK